MILKVTKESMIELILVKYNQREYEDECIQSILNTTNVPYNLTVYDNFPLNENLSVVWNRLIGRSNADIIVLVNTDTILEDGWTKMLAHLREGVGAVGPITNKCGTQQSGFKKSQKADTQTPVSTLSGFFIAFPRSVWEKVKFNEGYELYGEDSEWCEEVKRAGYKLIQDFSTHIFHYGGKSGENRKDLNGIRAKSRERFRKYNERNSNNNV